VLVVSITPEDTTAAEGATDGVVGLRACVLGTPWVLRCFERIPVGSESVIVLQPLLFLEGALLTALWTDADETLLGRFDMDVADVGIVVWDGESIMSLLVPGESVETSIEVRELLLGGVGDGLEAGCDVPGESVLSGEIAPAFSRAFRLISSLVSAGIYLLFQIHRSGAQE